MEHLSGGSLMDLVERVYGAEGRVKTIDASRIVKAILEAVAYLHSHEIAHRDLKPGKHLLTLLDNIMFAKKNDIGSLKLIDFGLSTKHSNKESTIFTGKCGTALYMAPEVFTNYQYSKVSFTPPLVRRLVERRHYRLHCSCWPPPFAQIG